jgi:hypothetical protein
MYQADLGVHPQELLQLVNPHITDDMNEALCKDFTDKEIGDTLFQIGPLKSSGPDGFLAHLF